MASQETIDKAVNEYGINNAAEMSDKQLKAEMQAIDDQAKGSDTEDEKETVDKKKTTKPVITPAAQKALDEKKAKEQ